jgi:hypothetical protein
VLGYATQGKGKNSETVGYIILKCSLLSSISG